MGRNTLIENNNNSSKYIIRYDKERGNNPQNTLNTTRPKVPCLCISIVSESQI